MAIVCLELTCMALTVASIFTSMTIGMMSKRIKELEIDIVKLKEDSLQALFARTAIREDIKKLNENNRIEVENDGWN